MIKIDNLSQRQREIMDLLWQCRDIEQVHTLIQSLPTTRDQQDAQSLVEIAIWETLEVNAGLARYNEDAQAVIDRCK